MTKGYLYTIILLAAVLLAGCGSIGPKDDSNAGNMSAEEVAMTESTPSPIEETLMSEMPLAEIQVKDFSAGVSVHDPSIVTGEDGKYYIFGSHMEAAVSEDLHSWKSVASGVNSANPLFTNLFEPDFEAFSFVGKNEEGWYSVWAPDVVYNEAMGKYVMYFCTTSSYIKSNICFAVSDSIEGPYEYVDTILYSGYQQTELSTTNLLEILPEEEDPEKYAYAGIGYQNKRWPNCIDPTVFYDAEGKMWMVYGSWSGGIFLLEIDEETGYPIHPETNEEKDVDSYYGRRLLGGSHRAIEGPYILYDEVSEYYYLFVSYGSLTREGGYQIRTFRSKSVEGPYTDASGEQWQDEMAYAVYGVKLMGNYKLPSNEVAYMAPGHCSAFTDKDGKMYVVYHTRFDAGTEYHEPRVHQLFTTESGWLAAAPFATSGEGLSEEGYSQAEMAGTWHMLNHGTSINSTINETEAVSFDKTGASPENPAISLQVQEGTCYATVTVEDVEYEGVIVDMIDEAGNDTRCITAVGSNNRTVWLVHYK